MSGNCIDGMGQFNYINGDSYKGSWKSGKPHGEGTFYYKSEGVTYVGQIKQDKFEGRGKLYLANGQLLYDGAFKNNMMHGKGTLNMPNADWTYQGNFVENKMQGQGLQSFTNGDTLEGNFDNGQANGILLFYDKSSNKKHRAEYKAGQFIRILK